LNSFPFFEMQLPEDFISLMHQHYSDAEADVLCHALSTSDPSVSVRLNRRKIDSIGSLNGMDFSVPFEPVPWCPDAYYLSDRPAFTFDPLLHAGVYYVQEASSMYLARILKQYLSSKQACVALDLCAAPGGKSTLLAGLLPEGSLLISNEPMPKRAMVLAENMTKWTSGMPSGNYPVQSLVTQNYPADFGALVNGVDLLVTDVPCSGEGMFRKDEQAVRDWSLQNVDLCWHRQREILQSIHHVLRPGGLLVYSTCTFNRFEDEDNARWICKLLDGDLLEERHFLPGRDRGEGFYVAVIRRRLSAEERKCITQSEVIRRVRRSLKVLYDAEQTAFLEGLSVELSYREAIQYLRRDVVRVESPRGPVVLCYKGFVLGPGKAVGNRINNLYPPEWRIRTTYTTPFSLFNE